MGGGLALEVGLTKKRFVGSSVGALDDGEEEEGGERDNEQGAHLLRLLETEFVEEANAATDDAGGGDGAAATVNGWRDPLRANGVLRVALRGLLYAAADNDGDDCGVDDNEDGSKDDDDDDNLDAKVTSPYRLPREAQTLLQVYKLFLSLCHGYMP